MKVALITGASQGIGRACALELARRGARVVAGARQEEKLAQLVEEIKAAGGQALAVRLDVAYNPHRPVPGPLLLLSDDGSIRRVNDNYRPPSGGFFRRLRLHVGIGHAF